MRNSKLIIDKIPRMRAKPKKLNLLSKTAKSQMTVRFTPDTLNRLQILAERGQKVINPKICRTDILESLVFYAYKHVSSRELKNMLLEMGYEDIYE